VEGEGRGERKGVGVGEESVGRDRRELKDLFLLFSSSHAYSNVFSLFRSHGCDGCRWM